MVLHVLVEGTSDVPTLREILTRRIGLTGGSDCRNNTMTSHD
jgi:hypothetical protein